MDGFVSVAGGSDVTLIDSLAELLAETVRPVVGGGSPSNEHSIEGLTGPLLAAPILSFLIRSRRLSDSAVYINNS